MPSCEVDASCASRYNDIYGHFGLTSINSTSRNRREAAKYDEALVKFDIYHPCYLINNGDETKVCPSDLSQPCWTGELCSKFNLDEIIFVESSSEIISATITAVILTALI